MTHEILKSIFLFEINQISMAKNLNLPILYSNIFISVNTGPEVTSPVT